MYLVFESVDIAERRHGRRMVAGNERRSAPLGAVGFIVAILVAPGRPKPLSAPLGGSERMRAWGLHFSARPPEATKRTLGGQPAHASVEEVRGGLLMHKEANNRLNYLRALRDEELKRSASRLVPVASYEDLLS